jgi:GT2 family glycosyltransferase
MIISMTEVLAVVVGYRNPNLSVRAMKSLSKQIVPVDAVLWDNYSTDADRVNLKKAEPPGTVVCDLENSLWTPAINKAVDKFLKPEHKFILTMNNDCELPPKLVGSLIDVFKTHPDAGMVGPLIPAIGGPNEPTAHRNKVDAIRVPYLMGACTLTLRSVWDQLVDRDGYGLDPQLPLGADDHDVSLRIKHFGYHLYVDPRVEARHKGHASKGKEWDIYGPKCWATFNDKWANYFRTEEEALKCHWDGQYYPDWDKGTGWTEEKFVRRMRYEDS